jgi:YfiH family protein
MQRLTHQALAYYQFGALRAVQHGIFTRLGGVSEGQWASLNMSRSTGDMAEPVIDNRKRALDALNLKPAQSLTSWLVHGNTVRVVTHDDLGHDDVHADAMVTQDRDLALTLRFADCVPVMFHDPVKGAIGIAHAGWKGIVNGVLPETVRAMHRTFGSQPQDIIAGVGPCIGPDKFEVGEDVAAQIQCAVSTPVAIWGDEVVRRQGDHHLLTSPSPHPLTASKPHVDLWKAAESQLNDAGVGQVEVAGICTASNTHEWFSHRAEQGKTGRFGAVIVL